MVQQTTFKFNLGDVVTDKVTKFEGAIVGRGDHISGCNTYGVQSAALKDGLPSDVKWFDEPRLTATGRSLEIIDAREVRTGADSVPQRTHQ